MKKIIFICLMLLHSAAWAMESVEQGIRLFNQKEYQQAQHVFQQQSDAGSANATFWLGVTQYKNRQHFEAGETFLKAAEMGDPWAMGVLGDVNLYVNNPCKFLGWPCDEKWLKKAKQGWKALAENGNGKAEFAYSSTTRDWWEYVPFYRQNRYQEIAIRGIRNGGYRFLDHNIYWDSSEDKLPYLKFAANQGYAPAMETLYYRMDTIGYDEAMKWINKAIELGYAEAARTLYLAYRTGEKDRNGNVILQPDPKKAYFYNRLTGALGGEEKLARLITQEPVHDKDGIPLADENGDPVFDILVTEQEQAKMDKQVAEFVKDIKPNLFLDETSIDLF
ncbi:sel1 repeat family protein [Vibrio furnissii]|uniref:sel1 repeat family protein n=1 Tax=Vibrio furnissii TaxID=29494 RepID=UPI001EEC8339|nr:sel1 repeat family protein [Vibrio furnissii]MCG6232924.1 sel1 repeat family protein [Vibrio furnissii]MCG6257754.1 sel1 repeat family protein [Vibrio furnissii]